MAEALTQTARQLVSPSPQTRIKTLESLANIYSARGSAACEETAGLRSLFDAVVTNETDISVRCFAISTGACAIQSLERAAFDPCDSVRCAALDALASFPTGGSAAVRVVLAAMTLECDERMLVKSLDVLCRIFTRSPASICAEDILSALGRDPESTDAKNPIPSNPDFACVLRDAVEHHAPKVRGETVRFLRTIILLLMTAQRDSAAPSPRLEGRLASCCSTILVQILHDDSHHVRCLAVHALAALPVDAAAPRPRDRVTLPEKSVKALLRILDADDDRDENRNAKQAAAEVFQNIPMGSLSAFALARVGLQRRLFLHRGGLGVRGASQLAEVLRQALDGMTDLNDDFARVERLSS